MQHSCKNINYIACEEIDAVQRKGGKLKAPPSSCWIVNCMYIQVPGQYNVVMRVKPLKSKYQYYFKKETGVLVPLSNDDSEYSYFKKKDENVVPVDPNYEVVCDEDDELINNEDSQHSKEVNKVNKIMHGEDSSNKSSLHLSDISNKSNLNNNKSKLTSNDENDSHYMRKPTDEVSCKSLQN